MTVYTSTPPDVLCRQIADDIHQLTEPIRRPPVRQRVRQPGGRRVTQWTAPRPLPSLLDALRTATEPGSTVAGPERRQVPGSRPAANLDALETLARLYVALSRWHAGLGLPSPGHGADWQKAVLRMLAGRASRLDPIQLDQLAEDVDRWWRDAARHAGLTTTELRELRG